MNQKQGENGVFVLNKKKVPVTILTISTLATDFLSSNKGSNGIPSLQGCSPVPPFKGKKQKRGP